MRDRLEMRDRNVPPPQVYRRDADSTVCRGTRQLQNLLHIHRFEGDGDAVHFAVDLVVAIDDADGFGLGAGFQGFR